MSHRLWTISWHGAASFSFSFLAGAARVFRTANKVVTSVSGAGGVGDRTSRDGGSGRASAARSKSGPSRQGRRRFVHFCGLFPVNPRIVSALIAGVGPRGGATALCRLTYVAEKWKYGTSPGPRTDGEGRDAIVCLHDRVRYRSGSRVIPRGPTAGRAGAASGGPVIRASRG